MHSDTTTVKNFFFQKQANSLKISNHFLLRKQFLSNFLEKF